MRCRRDAFGVLGRFGDEEWGQAFALVGDRMRSSRVIEREARPAMQHSTYQHADPPVFQPICVPSLIQFARQVTPPSSEKACSHRFVVGETIRHW